MKIAITGGTGFVGRHLARDLVAHGHEVVLISRGRDHRDPAIRELDRASFHAIGTDNTEGLARALAGCDAVAHLAGINRQIGAQTYERVHIAGTQNVVDAAKQAGLRKILLLSFLRARPDCPSGYHQSKWAAEEIVRGCGLDYTIIKAGVIYGRGDHMLDHLSHALHTFPLFGLVGLRDQPVRPLAIEDLVRVLRGSLIEGRLSGKTVAVTGPEQMALGDAVRRVRDTLGLWRPMLPLPVWFHYALAWVCERMMRIPMVSLAQIRILSEGIVEPAPFAEQLPDDLVPRTPFSPEQIRRGLPEPGAFGWSDLSCCCECSAT